MTTVATGRTELRTTQWARRAVAFAVMVGGYLVIALISSASAASASDTAPPAQTTPPATPGLVPALLEPLAPLTDTLLIEVQRTVAPIEPVATTAVDSVHDTLVTSIDSTAALVDQLLPPSLPVPAPQQPVRPGTIDPPIALDALPPVTTGLAADTAAPSTTGDMVPAPHHRLTPSPFASVQTATGHDAPAGSSTDAYAPASSPTPAAPHDAPAGSPLAPCGDITFTTCVAGMVAAIMLTGLLWRTPSTAVAPATARRVRRQSTKPSFSPD